MKQPDDAMPSRIPRRAPSAGFVGGGNEIQQAAERLRGQLVHTPLIGDVILRMPQGSGNDADPNILRGPRLKAECLQTGGTVEYRGALHYLLRRLGDLKGLVFAGPGHRLLACARAAESQRVPMIALCEQSLPRHRRELIVACGCQVEDEVAPERVAQAAGETGYHVMPWVEAEDFALGVGTLGLELGGELPTDLAKVYVSPAEVAPAIASGLAASGHGARVVAVDVDMDVAGDGAGQGFSRADLQRALVESVNLNSNAEGIAALGQALVDGDVDRSCVILSC